MGIVQKAQGATRLYLAELVLDLYDLLHQSRFSSQPVTLRTFGRIRGIKDEASLRSILRRVRILLRKHGIEIATVEVEGSKIQGSNRAETRLEFDEEKLGELVNGELDEACRVLERERKKSSDPTRRLRPDVVGSRPKKGSQLWIFKPEPFVKSVRVVTPRSVAEPRKLRAPWLTQLMADQKYLFAM